MLAVSSGEINSAVGRARLHIAPGGRDLKIDSPSGRPIRSHTSIVIDNLGLGGPAGRPHPPPPSSTLRLGASRRHPVPVARAPAAGQYRNCLIPNNIAHIGLARQPKFGQHGFPPCSRQLHVQSDPRPSTGPRVSPKYRHVLVCNYNMLATPTATRRHTNSFRMALRVFASFAWLASVQQWHGHGVLANANEANSRLQQVARADRPAAVRSDYPDYCWFAGLENRILFEYPTLAGLVSEHNEQLYREKNLKLAAELHRKIFMNIYLLELDKLSQSNVTRNFGDAGDKSQSDKEPTGGAPLDRRPAFKAAYKLYDLWANTPGNFQHEQGDYANYLDSYLIQARIEFWSYCLDESAGCRDVLSQLIVLARDQELGPIELLQVSTNIIMLMNSYKADLVLERLTDRRAVALTSGADKSRTEHDMEAYERKLADIVRLIETDDDFNEATFHYVFSGDERVHRLVDAELEVYLAHRIAAAGQAELAGGRAQKR